MHVLNFKLLPCIAFMTVNYPKDAFNVKIEELYLLEMKVDTSTCIGSSLGMLELMSMSHNDREEPEMGRGK